MGRIYKSMKNVQPKGKDFYDKKSCLEEYEKW